MTTWDPDAWSDYEGAAMRLDRLRRDATAAVASQHAAAAAAQDEIAEAYLQVANQRARFTDIVTEFGISEPELDPTTSDLAGAVATGPPEGIDEITAAVRDAAAVLDTAETTLASMADRAPRRRLLRGWPVTVRNALVHLWYAILATVAILEIDHLGGSSTRAGWVVAAVALVLSVVAATVGWLSPASFDVGCDAVDDSDVCEGVESSGVGFTLVSVMPNTAILMPVSVARTR